MSEQRFVFSGTTDKAVKYLLMEGETRAKETCHHSLRQDWGGYLIYSPAHTSHTPSQPAMVMKNFKSSTSFQKWLKLRQGSNITKQWGKTTQSTAVNACVSVCVCMRIHFSAPSTVFLSNSPSPTQISKHPTCASVSCSIHQLRFL